MKRRYLMTRVSFSLRAALVVGLALLAFGCATVPRTNRAATAQPRGPAPAKVSTAIPPAQTKTKASSKISAEALGIYRTAEQQQAPPSKDELGIIDSAKTLIGMAPEATVVIHGRQFVLDCIGTVAAIFYRERIDVTKDFSKYSGTGVDRLYKSLESQKVLHSDKYPRPGDVVIWDNTWDANDNGNPNDDPRTHAGVVLAVDEDGTIHYVHENYRRGVIIEVMNLMKPTVYKDDNGKILNSPMAMAPKPGEERAVHWVSGDLFDSFGDVLGARKHYLVAASENAPVIAPSASPRRVSVANDGSGALEVVASR